MLEEPSKELRVTGNTNLANPTLEIALVMDCTSSMDSWIQKAKNTLNEIVDSIVDECKKEGNLKVRVSFVGYRDIKDDERFRVLPFTDEINSVRSFIADSKAYGGGDLPEDLQGGLKLALQQDWTKEAIKRVFVICDAPCHGSKYHNVSDDYSEGSPDGLVLEDLMRDFCQKEIEFQVLKLNANCSQMIQVMKDCHEMTDVTDMTKDSEVIQMKDKIRMETNSTGATSASYDRYRNEVVRGAVSQVFRMQKVIRAFQNASKPIKGTPREQAAIRIQRKFREQQALKKATQQAMNGRTVI